MSHNETIFNALRELRACIPQEDDRDRLRQLVIEINTLPDMIEAQAAKIEGCQAPSDN